MRFVGVGLPTTIAVATLSLLLLECRKGHSFHNLVLLAPRQVPTSVVSLSRNSGTTARTARTTTKSSEDIISRTKVVTSSSLLDLESDESEQLITGDLGLTDDQLHRLRQLAYLVCDWNTRINLVSRRDCTPSVVWTRHVLPSISAVSDRSLPIHSARAVVDVGTGGGFPGLPLAVSFPSIQFLLVDSVGKKLTAVQDMANQLGLTNVQIYHGRAEDLDAERKFDVATGRSVSSLPQFCTWMHHLIDSDGHLMYWIGSSSGPPGEDLAEAAAAGDGIPGKILDLCDKDVSIEPLLRHVVSTDKRILTFDREAVQALASKSGNQANAAVRASSNGSTATPTAEHEGRKKLKRQSPWTTRGRHSVSKSSKAKSSSASRGSWKRTNREEPGKWDYDDFQRYDSSSSLGPSN